MSKEYKCIEVKSKKDIKDFLNLPGKLYDSDNPRNIKEEKLLLTNKHPISQDINFYPYILLDSFGEAICRCALTYYHDDDVAYLGFFDAVNEMDPVKEMLQFVERKAKQDGKMKIVGPIDASIYINYRFKMNRFKETYTSEPYNKEYYPYMWQQSGYQIVHRYVSNNLRAVSIEDADTKLVKIRDKYVARGIKFINMSDTNFDMCLSDTYTLLMELYATFPGYKRLSKEQFIKMYSPLKNIANPSMVKFAYKNGKLSAFAIAIPNYNLLTRGKLTLKKIREIKRIKDAPKEYVILYVGAEKSSAGLGCAIMQELFDELTRNGCSSIGALIKEGNLTGKIYNHTYTNQYQYALFEKNIY